MLHVLFCEEKKRKLLKIVLLASAMTAMLRTVIALRQGTTNKRQRTGDNKSNKEASSGKVDNPGKIEPWILNHDDYSSSLRHSEALRSRPKLEGTPVCHRFHSKGYCFDNCSNKATHINSSKLAPELKKEYEKWLKSVSPKN